MRIRIEGLGISETCDGVDPTCVAQRSLNERSVMKRVLGSIVLMLVVSNATAQDDFGDFGGSLRRSDASANSDSVNISREVRLLRLPHSAVSDAVEAAAKRGAGTASIAAVNSDAAEKVQDLLRKKADFSFEEEPLTAVARFFSESLDTNVLLDRAALTDENVDGSDTVTFSATNMSYGAALDHLLRRVNLTYTLSDNLIMLTSEDKAEDTLMNRVYPIWDLAKSPISYEEDVADYDTVVECITSTIAPNSWDDVGGPGSIQVFKGMIAVSNTLAVQTEVSQLLAALRKFEPMLGTAPERPLRVVELEDDVARPSVLRALSQKVRIDIDEPLVSAAEYIQGLVSITVLFDSSALMDENVDTSERVKLNVEDVTLDMALDLMLNDLNLAYVIDNEALLITSRDAAEETLKTRVYSYADFVESVNPADYTGARQDLDELIHSLQATIHPNSWDDVGGPAVMVPFPARGVVIVSQTDEAHNALQRHVDDLRTGLSHLDSRDPAADDPATVSVRVYSLSQAFATKDAREQLIDTLVRILSGSENALHDTNRDFYARVVGNKLVISHRRDAHGPLSSILSKLGAVSREPSKLGGGMF